MNRMGTKWRGKIPVPEHAHPLVREFVRRMNSEMTTMAEVAVRAGVDRKTISEWRYRRNPSIDNFEAALGAMDLELRIVRRKT